MAAPANGRWQSILAMIAAAAVIIGASITFFVQGASLSVQVAALEGRLRALEVEVGSLAERASVMKSDVTRLSADLVEVETQFCAQDIVRNLMHANDLRIQSMLWAQTFKGQHFPVENAYYPTICNRFSKGGAPPG